MIAFKFLRQDAVGPFSRVPWPAPTGDAPGAWVQAAGSGGVCVDRVHACRVVDLPEWIDAELWTVELDGDVAVDCGKLVADRGRLLARVGAWDDATAADMAAVCAQRARDAAVATAAGGSDDAARAAAYAADAARAAAYAADAARHAEVALAEPPTAPGHAATAAFIAAHAAALAAGDAGATAGERAWQARWLAERLALPA